MNNDLGMDITDSDESIDCSGLTISESTDSNDSNNWTSSNSNSYVGASDCYPKTATVKDQENLCCPYEPISGENVKYIGEVTNGIAVLSNYRFFYQLFNEDICYIISLGVIDTVQIQGSSVIQFNCKDVQTFMCSFPTPETCTKWHERITKAITIPVNFEETFAFAHYAWAGEDLVEGLPSYHILIERNAELTTLRAEVERLNFDIDNGGQWRVCLANRDFKLCPTYPRFLLVPSSISDDDLNQVAKFRSSRRIPVAVWRHPSNGAIIGRCSQPKIGWVDNRSDFDERYLRSILDVCDESCPPELRTEGKKLLIIDARSYSAAFANRLKGGGCESSDYYPHCEIRFMNIANIHSVRNSFNMLRALCAMSGDEASWLNGLDASNWMQNLSSILNAAVTVYIAVEQHGQPVLVHCSDGWDRTPQIVSLAEILLDPYYRTIEGFQVLIEREWLGFGHKFSSRCGFTDEANERCPVFLQWLDCVQNIHRQYPCAFEFSLSYLVKLAQHVYSNLFGTFLCNNVRERTELDVSQKTFTVWKLLQHPDYRNHIYDPTGSQTLCPTYSVRELQVWRELYLSHSNGELFSSFAKGKAKMGGNLAPSIPFRMNIYLEKSNNGNAGSSSRPGTLLSGSHQPNHELATQSANSQQVLKFLDPIDGLIRVVDVAQAQLVRFMLAQKEREFALEKELIAMRVMHGLSEPANPDVSSEKEFLEFCLIWENLNEVSPQQTDVWSAIERLEQKPPTTRSIEELGEVAKAKRCGKLPTTKSIEELGEVAGTKQCGKEEQDLNRVARWSRRIVQSVVQSPQIIGQFLKGSGSNSGTQAVDNNIQEAENNSSNSVGDPVNEGESDDDSFHIIVA